MKPDLAKDLLHSEIIRDKAQTNSRYAQNLYAALCNNDFCKPRQSPVSWCCGWYQAADIIVTLAGYGSRMDWCYSGVDAGDFDSYDNASRGGHVQEGFVTDEVMRDLDTLGWCLSNPKEQS